MPASWAGLGALLGGASERLPGDALTITTAATTATETGRPGVDFSGMWALPAAQAPLRSQVLIRALDSKGRLQLPVEPDQAGRLPVERDGAVVTVFLPGSTGSPRHGFSAAPQPMDARGRLTLTAALRREVGIGDGADVLAQLDLEARTVTVVAAGHMDSPIKAAIAGLRRTTHAATGATDLTDAAPRSEASTDETTAATASARTPSPRLHIVG
ncbi:hypothetical protein [Klenkia soli]|uniref:hypothetical protein n=1 Tax=Klenkia soli TaxID=1052260 RepID=UPI000B8294A1|nr:hypothetical protein [Klenkia soli]